MDIYLEVTNPANVNDSVMLDFSIFSFEDVAAFTQGDAGTVYHAYHVTGLPAAGTNLAAAGTPDVTGSTTYANATLKWPAIGAADVAPNGKSWIYVELPLDWKVRNDGTVTGGTDSIGFEEFNSVLYYDIAADVAANTL